MGKVNIREIRLNDRSDYVPALTPEQRFVFCMFLRAVRDAIETQRSTMQVKRDARAWLLHEGNEEYSAEWWSEISNLEAVFRLCQIIVREDMHGISNVVFFRDRSW
jgi:hypothetical protein